MQAFGWADYGALYGKFHSDSTFILLQLRGGFVLQSRMKTFSSPFARFVVLPAFAACLFLLVGCSSGGGSTVSAFPVTATPSASPFPDPSVPSSTIPSTSTSGVTVVASYDSPINAATVTVSQPLNAATFSTADLVSEIVEYHIYRNGALAAKLSEGEVTALGKIQYIDHGQADGFAYSSVDPADNAKLAVAQSAGTPPFLGQPTNQYTYRITLLFLSGSTYKEKQIGQSNLITLYQ